MKRIDSQIHGPIRIDPAYAALKRNETADRLRKLAQVVAKFKVGKVGVLASLALMVCLSACGKSIMAPIPHGSATECVRPVFSTADTITDNGKKVAVATLNGYAWYPDTSAMCK